MSWIDELNPASFRGVPFGVLDADSRFGRRLAVHEYPFRDKPWIEDLGRATRKISFRGFIVSNDIVTGGGDVIDQKEALIAAAEEKGPGTLVHPTLGVLNVSLVELGVTERWDTGQFFELGFSFIESGDRLFPSISVSTLEAVLAAAFGADGAAAGDFATRALADLKYGSAIVNQAAGTAALWARQAQRLGSDATNLKSLVSQLQGNYGRYFGGRNYGGFTGITSSIGGTSATIQSLINQGTVARNQISLSGSALSSVASALSL